MPVQAVDIKFYLTGGSGNTDPNLSLGGAISTTEVDPDDIANLFDNITGTNHAAGEVDAGESTDYRVLAAKLDNPLNDASSSTLDNAFLKKPASDLGDNTIEAYVSATVNNNFTAGGDENTAPTDGGPITFATIPGGGLAMPATIAPDDYVMIALKRTIAAGSSPDTNSITLQVIGDTI